MLLFVIHLCRLVRMKLLNVIGKKSIGTGQECLKLETEKHILNNTKLSLTLMIFKIEDNLGLILISKKFH